MLGLEDFPAGHSGSAQLRVVRMYWIHAPHGDWSMNDECGVCVCRYLCFPAPFTVLLRTFERMVTLSTSPVSDALGPQVCQ